MKGPLKSIVLTSCLAIGLSIPGSSVFAKQKVKVAFIGPLTGGVSANGIGGRNSAELAYHRD